MSKTKRITLPSADEAIFGGDGDGEHLSAKAPKQDPAFEPPTPEIVPRPPKPARASKAREHVSTYLTRGLWLRIERVRIALMESRDRRVTKADLIEEAIAKGLDAIEKE